MVEKRIENNPVFFMYVVCVVISMVFWLALVSEPFLHIFSTKTLFRLLDQEREALMVAMPALVALIACNCSYFISNTSKSKRLNFEDVFRIAFTPPFWWLVSIAKNHLKKEI